MNLHNLQEGMVGRQEGQPIQQYDCAPILCDGGARRSRPCGGEGREMGALRQELRLFLA
jgi:hypothetical protein